MTLEHLPGYAEALKAVMANQTPRAQYIASLERFVDGTQYEGLPDWFSDDVPLWERAPCIVYPIVKSAIGSNVDLVLGEGRFPLFTVEDVEIDESEDVEYVIARVIQQSRLRAAAREIMAAAQGATSACAIFGLRGRRLHIDTVRSRWCTPELDAEGAVRRLEIQYPYLTTAVVGGSTIVKAMLFRRVIDDDRDITYLPAEARVDGVAPEWREDKSKSVRHGLGFCPVVWYPHMAGCQIVGEVDGTAIHEHLTDEIRAHDFALSQRHRAALYTGDPQWTEIGVEPGYNPTAPARGAGVPSTLNGGKATAENPVVGAFRSRPRNSRARKKSPGVVWQYDAKPGEVEVKLHTLPGEALDAIDKHARDLRIKLAESLGVVFLDPESLPAASSLSGRALEALRARQLDKCDGYRSDVSDKFLLPAIGMLLRIALARRLPIDGLDVVERVVREAGELWSWHTPPLTPAWGRYFRLDAAEESALVELVAKAKDAGLVTRRSAIEKLRAVFDIEDIDAFLEELEDEQNEQSSARQALAAQMMLGTLAGDDGTDADHDAGTDGEAVDGDAGSGKQGAGKRRAPTRARSRRRPLAA